MNFLNKYNTITQPAVTLAVLCTLALPAHAADSLGRLFYSPQQRAQLDFSYARNATETGGTAPILTINGIVQKDGGPRTVWINGVAQKSPHSGNASLTSQTVTVPGKSGTIRLKVGDKILLNPPSTENQATDSSQP